jgi:hypothetical protein
MKGKSGFRNWFFILALGFSMYSLAVSYAASISADDIPTSESSKTACYRFAEEYDSDFGIKLHRNSLSSNAQKAVETLEAYFTYDDKILKIDGVEAFDISDLLSGNANIAIKYRMETKEENKEAVTIDKTEIDLGVIPFFLSNEELYWRIYNGNGAWGVGDKNIGRPAILDKLIPRSIDNLHGYNLINEGNTKELKATIILKESEITENGNTKISLSSLNLPIEITHQLTANNAKYSTLEVIANYYFSVPFEFVLDKTHNTLDFKNATGSNLFLSQSQIQGVVTLKKFIKLIND